MLAFKVLGSPRRRSSCSSHVSNVPFPHSSLLFFPKTSSTRHHTPLKAYCNQTTLVPASVTFFFAGEWLQREKKKDSNYSSDNCELRRKTINHLFEIFDSFTSVRARCATKNWQTAETEEKTTRCCGDKKRAAADALYTNEEEDDKGSSPKARKSRWWWYHMWYQMQKKWWPLRKTRNLVTEEQVSVCATRSGTGCSLKECPREEDAETCAPRRGAPTKHATTTSCAANPGRYETLEGNTDRSRHVPGGVQHRLLPDRERRLHRFRSEHRRFANPSGVRFRQLDRRWPAHRPDEVRLIFLNCLSNPTNQPKRALLFWRNGSSTWTSARWLLFVGTHWEMGNTPGKPTTATLSRSVTQVELVGVHYTLNKGTARGVGWE